MKGDVPQIPLNDIPSKYSEEFYKHAILYFGYGILSIIIVLVWSIDVSNSGVNTEGLLGVFCMLFCIPSFIFIIASYHLLKENFNGILATLISIVTYVIFCGYFLFSPWRDISDNTPLFLLIIVIPLIFSFYLMFLARKMFFKYCRSKSEQGKIISINKIKLGFVSLLIISGLILFEIERSWIGILLMIIGIFSSYGTIKEKQIDK